MFESSYLPFDEDHLPLGQEPIETTSLKQVATYARLLIAGREQNGYSRIAVVSGFPGVGKSIAIQAFLQQADALSPTGSPLCIEIRVKPDSTPRAFVEDLLLRLEYERAPRLEVNRYRLADRASEIIVSHGIRLIFVDEAEQLRADGFEFLRYIYGKSGCPLILVGDGRILPMLDRQPKFSSRSPLHLEFLPPSKEEILQIVLPQLCFSHWVFDPNQPEDIALGEDIWFHAKQSFRNLCSILHFASTIASMEENLPRINQNFLNSQVYPLFRLQVRKGRLPKKNTNSQSHTPSGRTRTPIWIPTQLSKRSNLAFSSPVPPQPEHRPEENQ